MKQNMSNADFLEFSAKDHLYYMNGVRLMGVTDILRAAGVTGGVEPAQHHLDRGTAVHALCETDDRVGLDMRKVPRDLKGYVRAWRAYRAASKFVPSAIEHIVWSPAHGYAGTMDRAGMRQGSPFPVVLDIKSMLSGSPPDSVRYQTVAYCHAYKPGQVFERLAVAVRPDGTFGVKVWGPETFQADLARWLQIVADVKKNSDSA